MTSRRGIVVVIALLLSAAWRAGGTSGPGQIALPTERATNIFFARAAVNGAGPLWLTLDTGANLSVLDPTVARSRGLVVTDAGRQAGVERALPTQLGSVRGVSISAGNWPRSRPRRSSSHGATCPACLVPGRRALGVDFMRRHVVDPTTRLCTVSSTIPDTSSIRVTRRCCPSSCSRIARVHARSRRMAGAFARACDRPGRAGRPA